MGGKSSKTFSKKERKHRPLSLSSKNKKEMEVNFQTEVIKKGGEKTKKKKEKSTGLFGGQE